jgi:serine/threonine-protein kinase
VNTPSWSSPERRGRLIAFGVIFAAALAGYLTTCVMYPAPILPKSATVPSLRGLDSAEALARLGELGLRGRVADEIADPLVAPGEVSWQSPAPETELPASAVVTLGISSGRPPVVVPDVVDLPIDLARAVIAATALKVGAVDTVTEASDFGTVVAQAPRAGTPGSAVSAVLLTVSRGPASVRVPEVVGLSLLAARDRLAAQGLRIGVLEQRFEGKAGSVLAQSPAAGELVTRESAVNLTISGALP